MRRKNFAESQDVRIGRQHCRQRFGAEIAACPCERGNCVCSNELLKATDGIAAALENTQRDLEKLGVQMQNYPQQTPVPHYAPPPRAGQTTDQPVASAYTGTQEPFDEARYRASWSEFAAKKNRRINITMRWRGKTCAGRGLVLFRVPDRRSRRGMLSGTKRFIVVFLRNRKEWRRAQTTNPYDRQQVVQQPVTGHLHRPTAMPFAPLMILCRHTVLS